MIDFVPQDLLDFITSGDKLEFDPTECEAGNITLCNIDQLHLSLFSVNCDDTDVGSEDPNIGRAGCYLVEGVDLIQESDGGYGSEGLLIWLPKDNRYAVWDSSHNQMFVFETKTRWVDIVKTPIRYLNAQWELGDHAPVSFLKPWINHVYNEEQVYRRFSIPAEWYHAEQTLRGHFVDGIQTRIPREITIELKRENDSFVLNVSVNHMDDQSNWINDSSFSRSLDSNEQAKLNEMVQANFWEAGELESDLGEPVIIWNLEGFDGNRYRSLTQFYSEKPKYDCVAKLGNWLLQLADVPSLETFLK